MNKSFTFITFIFFINFDIPINGLNLNNRDLMQLNQILNNRDLTLLMQMVRDENEIKEKFKKEHPLETELFDAIHEDNEKQVRELIPQIKDINIKNWNGETLLMYATRHQNNPNIVELLLIHPDIDVNIEKEGKNALYYAIKNIYPSYTNKEETIKLLLLAGTNITFVDPFLLDILAFDREKDTIENLEKF